MTKMPVPTIDPTLNIVGASSPIDRFRLECSPSAVISSGGLIRVIARESGIVPAMIPPDAESPACWLP